MRGLRQAPKVVALAVAAVVTVSLGVAWAGPDPEVDQVNRFSLTIDGFEIAALSRCSLSSESPEGGGDADVQILCERSLTDDLDLAAWHDAAVSGDLAAAKKTFSVIAYATDGTPSARWLVTDGYPTAITVHYAETDGFGNVGREIVTFTADLLQRVAA